MKSTQKIALVAVNARSSHSNPALFSMRTMLKKMGIDAVEMVELNINLPWLDILNRLTSIDCTHYLFSAYIWNETLLAQIISLLKQLRPEARMIVGGPSASYSDEPLVKFTGADLIVRGQGEGFIREFFGQSDVGCELPGVWEGSAALEMNEIPFLYEPQDRQALEGRLVYYETSRGCRFACSYCLSASGDQHLDFRDLSLVEREIPKLAALKPKIVKLVDRTFNHDPARARAIWQMILDLEEPVPFHFEIHPALLQEEDFVLLEQAPEGIFYIEAGVQSIHRDILRNVNRSANWPKIRENLRRLCSMKNLHLHLDQIAGLPGDSLQTAVETFNEVISLRPDDFQLGFLKLLPGTPLYDQSQKWGMKSAPFPPFQVVETTDLPYSDMKTLLRVERTLGCYYNSDYFDHTFEWALQSRMEPWELFLALTPSEGEQQPSRQWEPLAKRLWEVLSGAFPEQKLYIKDLMVLDWYAIAPSQKVPGFLSRPGDEEISHRRSELFKQLKKEGRAMDTTAFHHSLLFTPSSSKMRQESEGQVGFYRWIKRKVRVLEWMILG